MGRTSLFLCYFFLMSSFDWRMNIGWRHEAVATVGGKRKETVGLMHFNERERDRDMY